jgi:hypothetical protein
MFNEQNKLKWITRMSLGVIAFLTTVLVSMIIFRISEVNDPTLIQNTVSIIASLMSGVVPFFAIIYLLNVLSGTSFKKISD